MLLGLYGPEGRPLLLDSAAARPIENYQGLSLSPAELKEFSGLDSWRARVRVRAEATPRYNCHGLCFASRRTTLGEHSLAAVLSEDDYVAIREVDVLEGDVVLYLVGSKIVHSGVVVGLKTPERLSQFLVCSKWGSWAEVVHILSQCPYMLKLGVDNFEFRRVSI